MQLPNVTLADLIILAVVSTAQYAGGGGTCCLRALTSHTIQQQERQKRVRCAQLSLKGNTDLRPSVTTPAGMHLFMRKNHFASVPHTAAASTMLLAHVKWHRPHHRCGFSSSSIKFKLPHTLTTRYLHRACGRGFKPSRRLAQCQAPDRILCFLHTNDEQPPPGPIKWHCCCCCCCCCCCWQ